jgi:hypothetical protein
MFFLFVTLFGCALAYYRNWVQERRNCLAGYPEDAVFSLLTERPTPWVDPPWPLGWFGEEKSPSFFLCQGLPPKTLKRLRVLYPECAFTPVDPPDDSSEDQADEL